MSRTPFSNVNNIHVHSMIPEDQKNMTTQCCSTGPGSYWVPDVNFHPSDGQQTKSHHKITPCALCSGELQTSMSYGLTYQNDLLNDKITILMYNYMYKNVIKITCQLHKGQCSIFCTCVCVNYGQLTQCLLSLKACDTITSFTVA